MTNFYFVMMTAVACLAPSKMLGASRGALGRWMEDVSPDLYFNIIGPYETDSRLRKYRKKATFSNLYDAFVEELKNADPKLADDLTRQLNNFAQKSSQFGNYACIPNALNGVAGLNSLKGNTGGSLYVMRHGLWITINDQFALFLEWIFDHYSADPGLIDAWLDSMYIRGCTCHYRLAAKHYIRTFQAETSEKRIIHFTKYLKYVNEAIEARSNDIAKVLLDSDKPASNKEGRQ